MNTEQLQGLEQLETFAEWLARVAASYVQELHNAGVPESVIQVLAAQFQAHLLNAARKEPGAA